MLRPTQTKSVSVSTPRREQQREPSLNDSEMRGEEHGEEPKKAKPETNRKNRYLFFFDLLLVSTHIRLIAMDSTELE